MALLSVLMVLSVLPTAHAYLLRPSLCPDQTGGTAMPPGATFTDPYGRTWLAPSGYEGTNPAGRFGVTIGNATSFFFPGPQTAIPTPMMQGFGGVFGTYQGQQGWIVTDYCIAYQPPV